MATQELVVPKSIPIIGIGPSGRCRYTVLAKWRGRSPAGLKNLLNIKEFDLCGVI